MKLLLYFIAAHIILLSCAKNQKVAGKSKDINPNDSSDMTGQLKNWHPGHYVLLAENERVANLPLPDGFRGYQVKYNGKSLNRPMVNLILAGSMQILPALSPTNTL